MNFKFLTSIFFGFTLSIFLSAAEIIFQGFGKPWEFYSGTNFSKDFTSASMPIKSGGMYIGIRQDLKPGAYACSFEYKFMEKVPQNAQFQFSCTSKPAVHLGLIPNQTWTPVTLRIANTENGNVKFGLGITFSETNRLDLRNFKIEKLSDEDFKKIEYPTNTVHYWFNRSSDAKNAVLSSVSAEDHVLGGNMIQLKAKPEFKSDGLLCLMTLAEPLPQEKTYRLSFWSKSDKEGTVRSAISDHYHTYRIGPEWTKNSFDFLRKSNSKPTTNISFQALDKDIRTLIVKDIVIEQVK